MVNIPRLGYLQARYQIRDILPPGGQDTQGGGQDTPGILTPRGQAAQGVKINCYTGLKLIGICFKFQEKISRLKFSRLKGSLKCPGHV